MTLEPLPRYAQVKAHIMHGIKEGRYQAGDMLPSEHALVRDLSVSRMTVNRALRELVSEGHIIRRAGQGSFVAEKRMRGEAADILSIRDELAARGESWSASVLVQETVKPTKAQISAFDADESLQLARLMIVHAGGGVPIELEERFVNLAVAPDILDADFNIVTTTEYLMDAAPLLRAEHIVRGAPGAYG